MPVNFLRHEFDCARGIATCFARSTLWHHLCSDQTHCEAAVTDAPSDSAGTQTPPDESGSRQEDSWSKRPIIYTSVLLLAVLLGAIIAVATSTGGPSGQLARVILINETSYSNPIPPALSLSVGGGSSWYPVFADSKAQHDFPNVVQPNASLTIELGLSPAVTAAISVTSPSQGGGVVVIAVRNHSVVVQGLGAYKMVPRFDAFAVAYSRADARILVLDARYYNRAYHAYSVVFGGRGTALRSSIGAAVNATSIPLMKRGYTAISGLYSPVPRIETTIESTQTCWSDELAAYQAESFADNPANVLSASATSASTQAWNIANQACNADSHQWTALSQEIAVP
jgi:hypothetical protein